jgi:Tol biopolymer transport system component
MRKPVLIAAIILLAAASISSLTAQNGYDQFQKALAKERGEGNLEEAVALYQKVIDETKDESLAAKAQFRIGICFEKLGREKARQALDAFQKVLDKYPNQTDTVKLAREKIIVLASAKAPHQPGTGNLTVRKMDSLDRTGSVSPDGSFISFTDWGPGNLAAKDLTTGTVRLLTKNATGDLFVGHSVVSPDGRKIAYSWYDEKYNFGLWLINSDGSGNRRLYREEGDWNIAPMDWSPDGSQILAIHTLSYPSQACKIVLVAASDGSMKVLKELGRKVPSKMCFSPDGRYIVYDDTRGESTTSDIFVMMADGGREIPLVENPANERVLGWTPEGGNVLFASDQAGSWGAWLVSVRDGRAHGVPTIVKPDIGLIDPLGFTRAGAFYYGIGGWAHDVYAQDVDLEGGRISGQPELAVQRFVGSNGMPAWSPDGEHLAYISRRTPGSASALSYVLCIRSSKSGKDKELLPDLDWFQWPRWSPDAKSVMVVGSDRSNHLGAYKIDVLTGGVSPILLVEKDDYNPASLLEWSHDGHSVYLARNDWNGKNSEIVLRSLETKQERKIAGLHGENRFFHLPQVSPDGRSLATLITDQNRKSGLLAVMPAEGGEPRELLELKGKEGFVIPRGFAWGPDSRTFLFVKSIKTNDQEQPDQGRKELWAVLTESGEQRKLGDLPNGPGIEISLNPNGRSLVFSTAVSKSEIWIMENLLSVKEEK